MTATKLVIRPLLDVLGRGKLSILIYHRVHKKADALFPEEVDARRFDQHLHWLTGAFNLLPLADAVDLLHAGKLPPRSACITFDDGYADNAEVALPILRQHRVPAVFFISTGFLDGGRMWNDTVIESVRRAQGGVLDLSIVDLGRHDIATPVARRTAIKALLNQLKYLAQTIRDERVEQIRHAVAEPLPDDLMMRSEQVRELDAAGMTIGGHTVSHPILSRTDAVSARNEIRAGREALHSLTGKPVTLFAFPNGRPVEDYAPEHVNMVRELGFHAAVSTAWGAASRNSDLFQLPRFTPWDKTALRFSLRLTGNLLRQAHQVQAR